MKHLCHLVPFMMCGLLLPGCYLLHQSPCDEECVSSPPPSAPRVDGGSPRASPPSTPAPGSPALDCPSVRADVTCLDSFVVQPGLAFELPVTFDTCVCCGATACTAEADGRTQTLYLSTTLCPDDCECDTCNRPNATCAVPPLSEGTWAVVVNEAPAFELPVYLNGAETPPPPACATYAEPDSCATGAWLGSTGWRPSQVCAEQPPWLGEPATVTLTVTSDCWGCWHLRGPCAVRLEPRLTDDLPPGGELHVMPQYHRTACDGDCPAECFEAEQRCLAPPLVPGDFYRVWADGEVMLSFIAGDADGLCGRSTP